MTKKSKGLNVKDRNDTTAVPEYRKTRLPNGVRVVTENHPYNRAIAVGIWVETGTRDETPAEAGVSHFLEHLVFKRTKNRTAYQIARELEAVGGEINAFTSREYTCFYTHSLKEYLPLSIDVLSDIVCRAAFLGDEIEKEKQVVLQEISMSEDNLEDFIFDLYFEKAFGASPMGWPILGTEASITAMKRAEIMRYWRDRYSADRLIVSVAGAVDHDEVVRLVEKFLKPIKAKGEVRKRRKIKAKPFRSVVEKPSEQVHILMGLPASSFKDKRRFEAFIVSALLGGGMTSKLYQSVRERRGLVYSIYSQLTSFTDSGLMMIYGGAETKNVRKVVETSLRELKRLREKGVSQQDLKLFRTQVNGQVLLGADDVENRMNSLGVNEMVFGRYRPIEETIRDVNAVTRDSLQEYIESTIDFDKMSMLLLGACPPDSFKNWATDLGK